MHALIEQHREDIAKLCRRFGVRRLEVFGSAARGAEFDPATSDADFLVSFQNDSTRASFSRFFDLTEALESLLGRPVDLVSPDALTNPHVVASVNRARELIYGA